MRLCAVMLSALVVSLASAAFADDPQKIEFFETRIRPVLVKHCYECHSADAGELKGGLALDRRDGLLEGGDSGPALVPGEPDESILLNALEYSGLEMPPAGKLPENIIRDFQTWIGMGAPDPRTEAAARVARTGIDLEQGRQFWAFQPPQQHDAPAVGDKQWSDTWIDRFVLARLEEAGLRPAADVDRRRLLRRLTFDLTGLPPTPEELDAFAHDDTPEALQRAADRLLSSPRFGEHWGRHWLDVARYADSNGSDFNATFHEAWRYRDYVIAAFNTDRPFDRFIREQIAGDLLPYESDEQRAEQLVASGFLMLGAKMLSERDKVKLTMDVVDEQIDTVGRTFLGMTLGCARCHDHKFDPVPTADYYALAGIFRSTQTLDGEIQRYVSNWVRQPLPIAPEHAQALAAHNKAKSELTARIKQAKDAVKTAEEAAAKQQVAQVGVLVDDSEAQVTGQWTASTYSPQFVGKGYLHDDDKGKGEKSVTYVPDLPKAGEYEVRLSYASGGNRAGNVPIRIEHADGVAEVMLDQKPSPPIANLFKPIGRYRFEAGQAGSVTISNEGTKGHVMADAVHFIPVADLDKADEAASPSNAVADAQSVVKALEEELQQLDKNAPPPAPRALAPREAKEIGDARINVRGEPHNLGSAVPRGFLQVGLFDEPLAISEKESGRRELADWIADPRNPLTARVLVNRVWAHLIGEGIVRSVDNFGELGERPTHPELLDRLAVEFVEQGWSIKTLVRQIVLSRVYRMDTTYDEAAWESDPDNRLLWRANRRRLTAESIRDTMLTLAEGLDLSPGGSPVAGLGTLVSANRAEDAGFERGESNRRTLYTPIIRSELPSLLIVFDFADPDFVTGKRPTTTVPSQALFLMNSPFVRQAAERTAQRLLREASLSGDGRVEWAYLTALNRYPDDDERGRAREFVQQLTEAGTSEQQAWSRLIQALLASTEFRMLD